MSWADASDAGPESSLALRSAESALALRTCAETNLVKKEREDRGEDAGQPDHGAGERTSEAEQSYFDVGLEQK
mgnify:CR=1 FL=1